MNSVKGFTAVLSPNNVLALVPPDAVAQAMRLIEGLRVVTIEKGPVTIHVAVSERERVPVEPALEDSEVLLVFVGELYERSEAVRRLEASGIGNATTLTDRRLCVELYRVCGDQFGSLLNGSFSLFLWDNQRESGLVLSDRFGSHSVFHGNCAGEVLVLSTMLHVFRLFLQGGGAVDRQSFFELITMQRVLDDRTLLEGVAMLPAASLLSFDRDKAGSPVSYWTPQYRPEVQSRQAWSEELAHTVHDVCATLQGLGGRHGLLLSGGLNARMIAAGLRGDVHCFSFGDYRTPEVEGACDSARARGFDFSFLERDDSYYGRLLKQAAVLGNGMHSFNHAHGLGFTNEIAAKCDAIYHGYGVEALFRGTTLPRKTRQVLGFGYRVELDDSITFETLPRFLYARAYTLGVTRHRPIFKTERVRQHYDSTLEGARGFVAAASENCSDPYDVLLLHDVFRRYRYPSFSFCPSLRPTLTERSPMYDQRFIDLHLRMPTDVRFGDGLWLSAMRILDPQLSRIKNANSNLRPDASVLIREIVTRWNREKHDIPFIWRLVRNNVARGSIRPGGSPKSWPRFDWLIRNNDLIRHQIAEGAQGVCELMRDEVEADAVAKFLGDHLEGQAHNRDALHLLATFWHWWSQTEPEGLKPAQNEETLRALLKQRFRIGIGNELMRVRFPDLYRKRAHRSWRARYWSARSAAVMTRSLVALLLTGIWRPKARIELQESLVSIAMSVAQTAGRWHGRRYLRSANTVPRPVLAEKVAAYASGAWDSSDRVMMRSSG